MSIPENAIFNNDGSVTINGITFVDLDDYFDYIEEIEKD